MTKSPYIGLRAFDGENAENFFGRGRLVRRLLERLRESRFIGVLGMSGEGKSSLVLAGLIPALRAGYLAWKKTSRDAPSGHIVHWDITTMRPDVNPLEGLAKALAESEWGKAYGKPASVLLESLRRDPRSLTFFFRENQSAPGARLLIIVDQFEELFTRSRNRDLRSQLDADRFVDAIMDASTRSDQIYILVTMRSEYLGHCAEYADLADAITRGVFLVPRMRPTELVEAIELPAALEGGGIESDLVTFLVEQSMNGKMPLPVLQHALMRMWLDAAKTSKAGPIQLTFRHFERLGVEPGASLDLHLEEVFGNLKPGQKLVAEALFRRITKQTSRNEETGEYNCVREPATVREILDLVTFDEDWLLTWMQPGQMVRIAEQRRHLTEENIREVLKEFRKDDRAFLKPFSGEIDANTVIDVSHEAVINNWGRAKAWAAEEGENARTFQELCERARASTGLITDREVFKRFDSWLHRATLWNRGPPISRAWAKRYKGKREYVDFDAAVEFLSDSQKQLDRADLRDAIKNGDLDGAARLIARGVRLEDDFQKLDFAPHYFALVPDEIPAAMRAASQRGSRDSGARSTATDASQESVQTDLSDAELGWAFPKGPRLETSAGRGFRLQHYAAHGGDVRVLRRLGEMGLNFDVETDRKWTPFYLAVANGKLAAAKVLHNAIGDPRRTTGHADADNDYALSQAISWRGGPDKVQERVALVRWLLENGARVDEQNQRKTTPLHWAARSGRPEIIDLLVERRANLEARDEDERTPLHSAASASYTEAVSTLVRHGAAKDAVDKFGQTPLIIAAAASDERVVRALVEAGADVQITDRDGATALIACLRSSAMRPILPIVDLLIDKGPNVNGASYAPTGESALHLALARPDAWGERNALLRILVKKAGAFIDADDNKGDTPVSITLALRLNHLTAFFLTEGKRLYEDLDPQWIISAATVGAREIISWLLDQGARADEVHQGTTALHAAAKAGQYFSLGMLAAQTGVNLQVEDSEGLTPIRRALLENNKRSAEVLVERGAPMPRGLALEPNPSGPIIKVQSWEEICTTVRAQLEQGTKIQWPFAPLMSAPWTELDPAKALDQLRPILSSLDFLARKPTELIDAVRVTPAPFLDGGSIYEARMSKDGAALGYLTMLVHSRGFLLIDQSQWKVDGPFIESLRLNEPSAVQSYFRFYCGALQIDLGVLIPIEKPGDGLRDVPEPSAQHRQLVDAIAAPITVKREPEGSPELWTGTCAAQYGPELWTIRFAVNGRAEVRLEGDPLEGLVDYRRSAYANGLRVVTKD